MHLVIVKWWRRATREFRRRALLDAVWYGRRVRTLMSVGAGDTATCSYMRFGEALARLRAEVWESLGGGTPNKGEEQ